MASPRFRLGRAHKKATRTAGNITLNSTSWTAVNSGLDITLAAQVGDDLEFLFDADVETASPTAFFTVGTLVSAAIVNQAGSANYGPSGWAARASQEERKNCKYIYTVVSGDLSGGTVTCRLLYKTSTATNRTLYADTDTPLLFAVKNLGPADPN